jgi:hypothetical protein
VEKNISQINNFDFFKNFKMLYYFNKEIINFKFIYNLFSVTTQDSSSLYFSNSLISSEDFGLINVSSIKELFYKNFVYSKFFFLNLNFFFYDYSSLLKFNLLNFSMYQVENFFNYKL